MTFLKIVLFLTPVALVLATMLPGRLIRRRARREAMQAVADFRDTLPPEVELDADAEQVTLDAKWELYWRESAAYAQALTADINAYVGDVAAIVDRFEQACDARIKRFTIEAIEIEQERASEWGGWSSNIDREASKIIAKARGSLALFNHQLRVEVAECTQTQWTQADSEALNAYAAAQATQTEHIPQHARR
jgi:hypothetical protein